MGKPRMIILIRHAQSEGNKNRAIHQTVPDHRVKLTPQGWKEAADAGVRLRSLLRPDDTLQFFTSPYRRTRETTEGILSTLTSDEPTPSPFPRHKIKVYEEPRLREQDFGNFQPSSAEMERMWQERADYGHFFYRIPNGESAADAYDRISGFNESLWRQFGEDDCASVFVLVTHGLMTRVFLMKWYHFSVEYFEDLRNVNHCEFVIMNKNPDNGKYKLENKLRTWSELKLEQALAESEGLASPVPVRKKWIGCRSSSNLNPGGGGDDHPTQPSVQVQIAPSEQPDDIRGVAAAEPKTSHNRSQLDGSPSSSFIAATSHQDKRGYPFVQGRDFGGSMSGVGSRTGSCSSGNEDNDDHNNNSSSSAAGAAATAANKFQQAIMNDIHHADHPGDDRGNDMLRAQADRLGDHHLESNASIMTETRTDDDDDDDDDDDNDGGEEEAQEEEDKRSTSTMERLEAWDKSLEGSVY